MFLLDTNVVSELRRADRLPLGVRAWAEQLPLGASFLSAITLMELEIGVQLKERRDPAQGRLLRTWLEQRVREPFRGRVLAVDDTVALICAGMHVPDRRSDRDAYIAASAVAHGFTVVTRNTADFAGTGAALFDPWSP